MSEVLSIKTLTARKSYRCECCNCEITPGERYDRIAYLFEGEFCEEKRHHSCGLAVNDNYDLLDTGEGYIFPYDFLTDRFGERDEQRSLMSRLGKYHPDVYRRLMQNAHIMMRFTEIEA